MAEVKVSADAMAEALNSYGTDPKVGETLRRSGTKVVTDRCVHTLTVMHRYQISAEQAADIFALAKDVDTYTPEQIEAAMTESRR